MESTVEKIKFHYGYIFESDLLDEIIRVGNYRKLQEGDAIINYGSVALIFQI